MHLTVLVDNNTQVGTSFRGEPGLSYFIEADGKKILFDTGSSDLFIQNAQAMNLNLGDIDVLVLSHGHGDHTGGMDHLVEVTTSKKVKLVAHPLALVEKQMEGQQFGLKADLERLHRTYEMIITPSPVWISEHLVFLGEIPRYHAFENPEPLGERIEGGTRVPDTLLDDSALALRTDKGLFIITGCSHAGICNIIEYASTVCQESRIYGVIGGFHLFEADERTLKTAEFLKEKQPSRLYPCHCTSFKAKALLNEFIPIEEISVGMRVNLS